MNLLSYIIWNGSPEIFSIGPVTLRWYGLLFALGFLLSQQILYYIYKKEGKPEKDVDTLTIYMVIATIIGARLGHVLFYEPERYFANPIDILKIWEGGLASHGAAVGILFALWLYARKKKPGQSYLQVLDRIVILVALTGALIRLGNFFNSEIIGKQTHTNYGVVFTRSITENLQREPEIEKVSYVNVHAKDYKYIYKPMKILVEFKKSFQDEEQLHRYINGRLQNRLLYTSSIREHLSIDEYPDYGLAKLDDGRYAAVIRVHAVPRHPAQLYEAISCLLLFAFLFWVWYRKKEKLRPGLIFGLFMIILWSLRFVYEYLKEVQVDSEIDLINSYGINYGQLYSIPLVIVGIIVLVFSFKQSSKDTAINEKNS
ncbi:MAG: prolipoprotein diacylglyceryl transferase [Cyclobacteriaceae bacterium]|nr:prolipoprotein diacylglyceryl transferase [Cyclobacteriaceae bacterium]UYN88110.1 MAG: prolipoprotein diacylglyceryl transferase [Cyclobacteriaceae bacterium]